MLKIFHIVESTATGTLSMLSLLTKNQVEDGYDVYVLYSLRDESPKNMSLYFCREIKLINIQMCSNLEKLSSFFIIRNEIKKIKPGFLYLHSSFAGFVGRLSSLGVAVSCFYLPHCISFMRKDIGVFKSFLFILLEWMACIKPSVYIACSPSEREVIKSKIPFRNCELVVNAVDIGEWPNNNPVELRRCRVITVGSIRPQKRPDIFASICKAINKNGHFSEFVWVGDGDEFLKNQLEDAGVIVTGWKEKNKVSELLNSSYIYLSTASWEGLPVSIIEAMLSGCLVVASSCQGNIDIVTDGNGYTFKTVDEAVNIINESFKFDKDSVDLIEESRKRAMQFYSIERYASEMKDLVDKYSLSDY